MHILFTDDALETRELYRLCFTMMGHSFEIAQNGMEALRILELSTSPFDIIILDYHMPGWNGLMTLRQIRQMAKAAAVPVILFTGDTNEQLTKEAQALGISRLLHKPLMPNDLLEAVIEVVKASSTKDFPAHLSS